MLGGKVPKTKSSVTWTFSHYQRFLIAFHLPDPHAAAHLQLESTHGHLLNLCTSFPVSPLLLLSTNCLKRNSNEERLRLPSLKQTIHVFFFPEPKLKSLSVLCERPQTESCCFCDIKALLQHNALETTRPWLAFIILGISMS